MIQEIVRTNVSWAPTPNIIKMVIPTGKESKTVPEPTTSAFAFITRESETGLEVLLVNVIKRGFDLPGGHRENNESVYDNMVREVEEETGLKITSTFETIPMGWLHLYVEGKKPEDYHYPYPNTFMAYSQVKVPSDTEIIGSSSPDEISEFVWVNVKDIKKVVKNRVWLPFVKHLS